MKGINNRTLAREHAFKFLYHLQLPEFKKIKTDLWERADDLEYIKRQIEEFDISYHEKDSEHTENFIDSEAKDFSKKIIMGVLKNGKELEATINQCLDKWKMDNLSKIDLTILLLGTFELVSMKDTPEKVIINEAINMAKKFGGENSFSFINGILDKIAKSVR